MVVNITPLLCGAAQPRPNERSECHQRIVSEEYMEYAQIIENKETNETELHINGRYIAGWAAFEIPKEIKATINRMLEHAYIEGKKQKSKELQEFFNADR
jgi:hypothetical protein